MSNRKPFLPIEPDLVDDRLERLARDNGVGKFEKPLLNTGAEEGKPAAHVRAPKPANAQAPASKAAAKLKTVNLELPDYVWTELKIRAARQQSSLKHVVMKALRADGITIQEEDMIEDGRRLRGSNKLQ